MIDIFAGVDNITMLNTNSNSSNVVKLSISKVISVIIYKFLNLKTICFIFKSMKIRQLMKII
jgi:hypothetical protein